jgi:hypothetical protein
MRGRDAQCETFPAFVTLVDALVGCVALGPETGLVGLVRLRTPCSPEITLFVFLSTTSPIDSAVNSPYRIVSLLLPPLEPRCCAHQRRLLHLSKITFLRHEVLRPPPTFLRPTLSSAHLLYTHTISDTTTTPCPPPSRTPWSPRPMRRPRSTASAPRGLMLPLRPLLRHLTS